eukprot:5281068-Lingulodinium_polyedra.AAC.1
MVATLRVLFPSRDEADSLIKVVQDKEFALPGPSQITHARFIVDCALMCWTRKHNSDLLAQVHAPAIYLLTASSPQGRENWLMTESFYINGKDLCEFLVEGWRMQKLGRIDHTEA